MKHLINEARKAMCEDFGLCGEATKVHIKGAPDDVNRYYEKCRKDQPDKSEEYCARVAWQIYCTNKNPDDPSCTKYGKTKASLPIGESWEDIGPEMGKVLGADMRKLVFDEDEAEVLARWREELEKDDGLFASLSPSAFEKLQTAVEAGDKEGALEALAEDGLDYRDLPDEWELPATEQKDARLKSADRTKVNNALDKKGLGGTKRYPKVGAALGDITTVFAKFGIEPADVFSADLFMGDEGRRTFRIAFSNEDDPFSPVPIGNSRLAISWFQGRTGYEVVAYLS